LLGRQKLLLLFDILIIVIHGNQDKVDRTDTTYSQQLNGAEDLLSLDNATITKDPSGICLEVAYTIYEENLEQSWLGLVAALLLSLDDLAWIEVQRQTFDDGIGISNETKTFNIWNSLLHPFPSDIENGQTRCIRIEYEYETVWLFTDICQTNSISIIVPFDIIKPWYFTIDWTLPGMFGAIFISLLAVFLMSRYNRKQIEKRYTKSED
jgi:hypothetical protein